MPGHAARVGERFGVVHVVHVVHLVVNNACVVYSGAAVDQSLGGIARITDVNLGGVVHGTQVFLPHLTASGDGHLANISSLFGLMAVPAHGAYHASTFAIRRGHPTRRRPGSAPRAPRSRRGGRVGARDHPRSPPAAARCLAHPAHRHRGGPRTQPGRAATWPAIGLRSDVHGGARRLR